MRVISVLSVAVLALITTGTVVHANLAEDTSHGVKTALPVTDLGTVVAADHPDMDEKSTHNVELAGNVWLGSFEEAKRLAQEQGKPVLHLQMFGELDDEFC